MKDDLAQKYIAALMSRVHALRQPRVGEPADVSDEKRDEREGQNYAERILTWLRDRL